MNNITLDTISYNASIKGLSTFSSWGGVVGVLVLSMIIISIAFVLSNNERFKKYYKLLKKIQASLTLFVYGLSGYALIAGFYGLYVLIANDASTGSIGLYWVLGIITFYVLTCGLGVLMKKLGKTIKTRWLSVRKT